MLWPREELVASTGGSNPDGIMTACVFAWEDRADESCLFMRKEIDRYTSTWARLGPRTERSRPTPFTGVRLIQSIDGHDYRRAPRSSAHCESSTPPSPLGICKSLAGDTGTTVGRGPSIYWRRAPARLAFE
jgi:hypothetical protein